MTVTRELRLYLFFDIILGMEDSGVFDKGERVAKIGFIVVTILGAAKGVVGYLSSSVSLQAQAVDSLTDLVSLVVHIEPVKREVHRVAIPVDAIEGLGSIVSSPFGSAPFFMFVDLGSKGIERWFTKGHPAVGLEKKRGVVVTEILIGEDVTMVLSDELGEGPFHILRDSYVGVYAIVSGGLVRDSLDLFASGELELREEGGKKADT